MAKRNQDISLDRRIEFRIGVNIGDVIVEKGDVFGDGVNIAARLEQIAPAGGICLSEDAYRQVRGKIEIPIADAGEQSLKNIANPIRVYRIEASIAATFDAPPPPAESPRWSAKAIAAVAISAAIGLGAILWLTLPRDRTPVVQNTAPSKPVAASAMPVIAVLPFANQTGDSSQEHFADGVTEEVINALGRFNTVRVIGRNAVLRYWTEFPDRDLSRAAADAQKAIALAPSEPDGYRALGRVLTVRAEYEQSKDALKRAVEINPSDANALAEWGSAQAFAGEIGGAIESLQLALKLDPTLEPTYLFDLEMAYYLAGRYDDVLRIADLGLARYPDFPVFNTLAAAAAAQSGRKDQAAQYAEAVRQKLPTLDLESMGSRFKNPAHAASLREGLKLAGF
jgi:tetratricopeptide (TPR) repeat protein